MYPELRNVNAIGRMFWVHGTEAGLPFRAVVTHSKKKSSQASRPRSYPKEEPQPSRMICILFVGEDHGWVFWNVKSRAGKEGPRRLGVAGTQKPAEHGQKGKESFLNACILHRIA